MTARTRRRLSLRLGPRLVTIMCLLPRAVMEQLGVTRAMGATALRMAVRAKEQRCRCRCRRNRKEKLLRRAEKVYAEVATVWLKFRTLEAQKGDADEIKKAQVLYESKKAEAAAFSKDNGLRVPISGSYLYYRSRLQKFLSVLKPTHVSYADALLQKAMSQGKVEELLKRYDSAYKKKLLEMEGRAAADGGSNLGASAGAGDGKTDSSDVGSDREDGSEQSGGQAVCSVCGETLGSVVWTAEGLPLSRPLRTRRPCQTPQATSLSGLTTR